jgi:TatA/E family protein of Tat protein translocase
MPNIGPVELIIILVIALLILGPGRLPDVGSALGKSIREFRKAASDVQESVSLDAPPAAPAAPASQAAAPAPVVQPTPNQSPDVPAPNTLAAAAVPNVLTDPSPTADAAAPADAAPADAAPADAAPEPAAVSPEAKV